MAAPPAPPATDTVSQRPRKGPKRTYSRCGLSAPADQSASTSEPRPRGKSSRSWPTWRETWASSRLFRSRSEPSWTQPRARGPLQGHFAAGSTDLASAEFLQLTSHLQSGRRPRLWRDLCSTCGGPRLRRGRRHASRAGGVANRKLTTWSRCCDS